MSTPIVELAAIVRALARCDEPTRPDEQTDDTTDVGWSCALCSARQYFYVGNHEESCPWLRARVVMRVV